MNKGFMAKMADNHVAANLLMLFFLVGGAFIGLNIKQEVFPEMELDQVRISVSFPGASPEEVEEAVLLPLENALEGLEGIEKIRAKASESGASVTLDVIAGENVDQVVQDVKSAVDRISNFPEDLDTPSVYRRSRRRSVLEVSLSGHMSMLSLHQYAERLKEDLLSQDDITEAELEGNLGYEIAVVIPPETLRKYGLSLSTVASKIKNFSVSLPAGSIKARNGEIILRSLERRYWADEYKDIPLITKGDGTRVLLGDVAELRDGFEESDLVRKFDGKENLRVQVYRTGDQKPSEVAKAVQEVMMEWEQKYQGMVHLTITRDRSEILKDRIRLLLGNAWQGLFFVILILAIFLEFRLALWVAMGIPISFLGALFFAPHLGVTINMISTFAFILALGIVVDDAIVVGENIFTHRNMGKSPLQASLDGVSEVMTAVTFSVLTTVAAFSPLMFIEGRMGKFIYVVPVIVILILLVSLVEAFLILPAHLNKPYKEERSSGFFHFGFRDWFRKKLKYFIEVPYTGLLKLSLEYRSVTIAVFIAAFILSIGMLSAGVLKFRFMSRVEGDTVIASFSFPPGTWSEMTAKNQQKVLKAAMEVVKEYDNKREEPGSVLDHTYSAMTSDNSSQVFVYLKPVDERGFSSREFAQKWRRKVGQIPGADRFTISTRLLHFGSDVDIRLSHGDAEILKEASARIKNALHKYDGITDIEDTFDKSKREIRFKISPEAAALGIQASDLARQIRNTFYGVDALTFQRGANEVTVNVRFPQENRRDPEFLNQIYIYNSSGQKLPLYKAAIMEEARGFTSIERSDRKRILNISADVREGLNPGEILKELQNGLLVELVEEYPGLQWKYEGAEERRARSMGSIYRYFPIALFVMYALMAIPFKSYIQPIIVMAAIPFGFVGAVWGHLLLGQSLTIMSVFGLVAVAGVAVNDSLVLVDFINNHKQDADKNLNEALVTACQRRFRPILLTSLTTFFGLLPMMLETSIQAQMLIPMAISLAFGVLFTTLIALILVPSIYSYIEDVRHFFGAEKASNT